MRPVIIIFGAAVRRDGRPSPAMQNRVAAAVAAGRKLADPVYMPTGGRGRYGAPEAEVMTALLQEAGVPLAAVEPEPTGRNTLRSVLACARLLGPARRTVHVATSSYHLPRCLLLLRLAGYRAIACPPPRGPASNRMVKRWFWRLRELAAVPIDGVLMLGARLVRRQSTSRSN